MTGRTLDLLLAVPLLGAFIVLFAPRQWATAIRRFSVAVTIAELALSGLLLFGDYSQGGYTAVSKHGYVYDLGIGIHLGADGVSAALVLLTTLITPIALFSSWSKVTTKVKEHAVCFLLLEAGLIGAFFATDLFFFYVCWELVLIPLYVLIGIWGTGDRAVTSTKFFMYTLAGSMVMLVAILYLGNLYSRLATHPSYAFADLHDLVLPMRYQVPLFLAFALAFFIKMPLFPLHTWSPETYRDAPTSVAIMASALVAKLGGYGLFRIALGLFPLATKEFVGPTCAVFAVAGMLYGAFAAFGQRDLKMLLAYASMSHMGYVALGLLTFSPQGMTGAIVQMLSHGITTAGLFLLVGTVESRFGSRQIDATSGLATGRPWLALVFVLIAFAGAGVPGTSGFVGEFLVIAGAYASTTAPGFANYHWSFTFTGALAMIFGALYILLVLRKVVFGPPRMSDADKPDLTWRESATLVPLAVLVVALGVFPSFAVKRIEPAITSWLTRADAETRRATEATIPYVRNPAHARPPTEPLPPIPSEAPEGHEGEAPGAHEGEAPGAHEGEAPRAPQGDIPRVREAAPSQAEIRVAPGVEPTPTPRPRPTQNAPAPRAPAPSMGVEAPQ